MKFTVPADEVDWDKIAVGTLVHGFYNPNGVESTRVARLTRVSGHDFDSVMKARNGLRREHPLIASDHYIGVLVTGVPFLLASGKGQRLTWNLFGGAHGIARRLALDIERFYSECSS